jgi:hypothetical protein
MVHLRKARIEDEAKVLTWRNSPAVATFMYRDDPISQDEHQRWFQNILEDSASSRVRILESDSQASGLASLTKIDLANGAATLRPKLIEAEESGEQCFFYPWNMRLKNLTSIE